MGTEKDNAKGGHSDSGGIQVIQWVFFLFTKQEGISPNPSGNLKFANCNFTITETVREGMGPHPNLVLRSSRRGLTNLFNPRGVHLQK